MALFGLSTFDVFSPIKKFNVTSPLITTDLLYTPTFSSTFSSTFSPTFSSTFSPIIPTTVDRILLNTSSDPLLFSTSNASINLTYSKPLLGVYNDLNSDPAVQKRITNMIRMKTLDKWLYEDLKEVLGYFKVDSSGQVDVINSVNDYATAAKDSDEVLDKKIDFIEKYFLTYRSVNKILMKYIRHSNSEWVKIPHAQFYVRQLVGDHLTKMVKQAIKEKAIKK